MRDLFAGQEICRTEFTVAAPRPIDPALAADAQGPPPGMPAPPGAQLGLGLAESDLGIGNRLMLLDDELLANTRTVQLRHGLRLSESLPSRDFTVEVEAGTGKTYVYLRTVFELNHGGDGGRDQQERCQQPLQGKREDRR